MKTLFKDFSFSAVIAGFVTVLVGFSSSGVLVFQAAQALGATPAQSSSWLWALCMGMGLTSIGLSWYYKTPIPTAWSTAAAAMLITIADHISLAEATGAFIVSGLLITVAGFSGIFERLMKFVPMSLASAMLAGILLRFSLQAVNALQSHLAMILAMFIAYLLCKRLKPRYAVLMALIVGIGTAYSQGLIHLQEISYQAVQPEWVKPSFSWHTVLGVAVPLFLVTMTSQNMAGIAAIRSFSYHAPVSPLVGWTGLATVIFAPMGAFAISLAAITAAICLSSEAHEDKQRRYVAGIMSGIFYLLLGIFAATLAHLLTALPKELVTGVAGIALLGTIGNGLVQALAVEQEREAALICFVVTVSGINLLGIGAAFWGLIAGAFTLGLMGIVRVRGMANKN
ncbi:MAG TPA: benzoate/H(+) symporter BenE family transporter [Agitococcus sp.]|nr:benzoate/H(+) symporter BenE family transporter [Agitococcus sp.]